MENTEINYAILVKTDLIRQLAKLAKPKEYGSLKSEMLFRILIAEDFFAIAATNSRSLIQLTSERNNGINNSSNGIVISVDVDGLISALNNTKQTDIIISVKWASENDCTVSIDNVAIKINRQWHLAKTGEFAHEFRKVPSEEQSPSMFTCHQYELLSKFKMATVMNGVSKTHVMPNLYQQGRKPAYVYFGTLRGEITLEGILAPMFD